MCKNSLFLDIKKAFDTDDHNILLDKLCNTIIHETTQIWFIRYLYGRQPCVKINRVLGETREVIYALLQV